MNVQLGARRVGQVPNPSGAVIFTTARRDVGFALVAVAMLRGITSLEGSRHQGPEWTLRQMAGETESGVQLPVVPGPEVVSDPR